MREEPSAETGEAERDGYDVEQYFAECTQLLVRRFILDLAVRGKLVPQDPNDEPASELLKRIAAEKAQLPGRPSIRKLKAVEGSTRTMKTIRFHRAGCGPNWVP